MSRPRVLVTGATGFIGSHFLLALDEKRPSDVLALVRGADEEAASAKLKTALRAAAESYRAFRDHAGVAARARVILGDITADECGVSPADVAFVRAEGPLDEVWHFAASLSFEEKQRAEIHAHNVGGTGRVVDLAARLGAKRFVYVSTAYTAGKKTGVIREELHDPAGPFNNVYEETKCAAEHLVMRLCAERGIALTIIRPSVVIGPSETKRPGGSTSGLYGFIREMNRLSNAIKNWGGAMRITASADIPLNLIPVDGFAQDCVHVARAGFDVGPIVHATSTTTPTVKTIVLSVAAALGLKTIELHDGPKDGFSPLEQLVDKRIVFYGGYLQGEKHFERSLPGRYDVTDQDYRAFVAEGVRERRRTSVTSVFTRGVVRSFDGTSLSTYVCGKEDGTPVVLSNAVGMPAAFWTRVASRLAKEHRVVTWETRGVPSFSENFAENEAGIDAHVRDLVAVMDAHGMESAHVLGWCTGALVAMKSAFRAPERVRSLVLLNGSYSLGEEHPRRQFEKNMRLVMPKIAASRKTAELYYRTIYLPKRSGDNAAQADEAATQMTELLMSTDPDLIHLTSFPYDNVDTLHRYGRLITEALREDIEPWVDRVACPAFVVTGELDATEHPGGSRYVASRLHDARLVVHEDMDHFGLFTSAALCDEIAAFLESQPAFAPTEPQLAVSA
jgi:nucleoside-diphosphate-sugar epimerase/pimeloyl-ACP methyl ester carboxylesterase